MRRAGACAAFALLVVALALPARGEEGFDPYEIPREQFRARVSRVALRPLRLPDDVPDSARVQAEFERLIAAQLEKRGYTVVGSQVFEETWHRFSSDLGGVFDPVTGMAVKEKYALAQEHTARELERTHDVDAILTAVIAVDAMPAYVGWNWWQAAGKPIRWQGDRLPSAPIHQPQRVEGPVLLLTIHDGAQVLLYGGRIPLAWSRVFFAGGYDEIPAAEVYDDSARNQEVVEVLLGPLVDRKAGSEETK